MSSHFSFYCCAEGAMDSLFHVTSSSCPARSIPHPSPPSLPLCGMSPAYICLFNRSHTLPAEQLRTWDILCPSSPDVHMPYCFLSAGSFQWDATQLPLRASSGSTEPPHPLLSLPWYLSVTFQHTELFCSFTALRDCYLSHRIGKPSSGGSAGSFIPCSPPGDVYHLTHAVVRKQPTHLRFYSSFLLQTVRKQRIVFISDF